MAEPPPDEREKRQRVKTRRAERYDDEHPNRPSANAEWERRLEPDAQTPESRDNHRARRHSRRGIQRGLPAPEPPERAAKFTMGFFRGHLSP